MNELTRNVQDDVPWCMPFIDDILLVDETKREFIPSWRFGETLKSKGFRINITLTNMDGVYF